MSLPNSSSKSPIQQLTAFRSSSPALTPPRRWRGAPWSIECDATSSECFVVALFTLRNSGSRASVRCRSKPSIPITTSTETFDFVVRRIGANWLMLRSRFSMRARSASSGTRSTLFSRIRSANATCCTLSLISSSPRFSSRCCSTCLASTKQTTPSSRANALIVGSMRKVCATGAGSAIPVVSITIASRKSVPWRWRSASFLSTLTRSERTEQHTQPLSTSTISCSDANFVFAAISASSIPTSPNSF